MTALPLDHAEPAAAGLQGRVAIVTGGASGIGLATARALAAGGATVVVADIDAERASAAATSLAAAGGAADAVEVDVTDEAAVAAAVDRTVEAHGRIDVLVNNAGYAIFKPFAEHTIEDFDRMYAVHVRGTVLCSYAVAGTMIAQRFGRIVNVSSGGALGLVSDYAAAYQTAKASQAYVGRTMAVALAPHGITVNSVVPGAVDTALWRSLDDDAVRRATGVGLDELLEGRASENRLGRNITPEEVARVIAFLADPASSAIHDQTIMVA